MWVMWSVRLFENRNHITPYDPLLCIGQLVLFTTRPHMTPIDPYDPKPFHECPHSSRTPRCQMLRMNFPSAPISLTIRTSLI